jgi:hypothetical protein
MTKGQEPLPLFDCLFCCQEHYVLAKFSEGILCSIAIKMQEVAVQLSKKHSKPLIYTDFQHPVTAMKILTASQNSVSAPKKVTAASNLNFLVTQNT